MTTTTDADRVPVTYWDDEGRPVTMRTTVLSYLGTSYKGRYLSRLPIHWIGLDGSIAYTGAHSWGFTE